MRLPIITIPNPILKQPCPCHEGDYQKLVDDLLDTMEGTGVGLAAPQIGISTRVAVVRTELRYPPLILVNAQILDARGEAIAEEGCLSCPGVRVMVKRYEHIEVISDDWEGVRRFHYLTARVVQHEVSHWYGELIADRAT